ncbi:MAG: ABC transporter ATP-binding protein [Chloroflexota bacterium]|nr:ABC transporter ATP-binding protein [Chloroflexota bacterium]
MIKNTFFGQLGKYAFTQITRNKLTTFISSFLLIVSGFLDAIGLSLIVPTVNVLVLKDGQSSAGRFGEIIKDAFDLLGIPYSLRFFLLAIAAIMLLRSIFIFLQGSYCGIIRANYILNLRIKYLNKLKKSSWKYLKSQPQSKLLNIITLEIQRAGSSFLNLQQSIASAGTLLIYLIFLFLISTYMAIFAILSAIFLTLLFSILLRIARKIGEKESGSGNLFYKKITESITLSKYLRAHGKEDMMREEIDYSMSNLRGVHVRAGINNAVFMATYEYAFIGFISLGLLIGSQYLNLDGSQLALISLVFYRLFQKTKGIQQHLQFMSRNIPATINIDQEFSKIKINSQIWGDKEFISINNSIKLSNLSLRWDKKILLEKVNLKIESGTINIIVGPSGEGKTTLIDSIAGIIKPQNGTIKFDDIEISEFSEKSFKSKIAYIDQNATLFNESIIDNISWGNEKVSKNKIYKIAKDLDMHDKIKSLKNGYNTVVGDRGANLSGGEAQRIIIIRALIKNPNILILDEAINQLDSKSKKPIIKTLKMLKDDMTIFIISHSEDTINLADNIFEVSNNSIKKLNKNKNWINYFKS